MHDDLNIVHRNVRHYENLLAAAANAEQRQQVLVMLADARAELRRARVRAVARRASSRPPVD
jgi:hypothetical protein